MFLRDSIDFLLPAEYLACDAPYFGDANVRGISGDPRTLPLTLTRLLLFQLFLEGVLRSFG
jgi:hypothetical protein